MQTPAPPKNANFPKSKNKARINKRQRNRRRNKLKSLSANQTKPSQSQPFAQSCHTHQNSYQNGTDLWRQAYENALRWHGEHQSNFWRGAAEKLLKENQMLQHQIAANSRPADVYYETSDEEEDEEKAKVIYIKKEEPQEAEEDDDVDVQYLEFLQITFKHREDLRLKRQAEAEELALETSEELQEAPAVE